MGAEYMVQFVYAEVAHEPDVHLRYRQCAYYFPAGAAACAGAARTGQAVLSRILTG
ncbi:hypothetical protein D3C86_2119780 [compost metagenome]